MPKQIFEALFIPLIDHSKGAMLKIVFLNLWRLMWHIPWLQLTMADEELDANIEAVISALCKHRNPALGLKSFFYWYWNNSVRCIRGEGAEPTKSLTGRHEQLYPNQFHHRMEFDPHLKMSFRGTDQCIITHKELTKMIVQGFLITFLSDMSLPPPPSPPQKSAPHVGCGHCPIPLSFLPF